MPYENKEKSIDVYVIPTVPSKKVTRRSFWHVDRETIRFKLHFFLYLGAISAAAPYIVVLAKERIGISATSLGAVLTSQMFLIIFTKPLIGYIADYFNKLKIIITVLSLINIVCFFLLLSIPRIQHKKISNLMNIGNPPDNVKASNVCEKYGDLIQLKKTDEKDFTSSDIIELVVFSSFNFVRDQNEVSVFIVCFPETNITSCSLPNCTNSLALKNYNNFTTILQKSNRTLSVSVTFYSEELSDRIDPSIKYLMNQAINSSLGQISEIIFSTSEEKIHLLNNSFINYELNVNSSTVHVCFMDVKALCSGDSAMFNKSHYYLFDKKNSGKEISDFATYQFWIFALFFTTGAVCGNAIFTVSDTACCETIEKTGAGFGRQRLWGAVSWGLIAPLAGFMNDYSGDYLMSWSLMTILFGLFLWNISKLDLVKPQFSKNILKDVGTVLQSREFLAFELGVLLNGLGAGMIWFDLIWFLTSIGASELLCGLCLTVQCFFGSIPVMFFSDWVIKKIGHFNIVILSLAGYFVRFLWYSYLQNPWFVFPVEFLHGLTYGLYYPTLADYGKKSAKPGTEATTLSIIFSTHEGLGAGIGCVVAGLGFDHYGGHKTFYISSMVAACGVLITLVSSILVQTRQRDFHVTKISNTVHSMENGLQITTSTNTTGNYKQFENNISS